MDTTNKDTHKHKYTHEESPKKILVYGAGALGSLLAARLHEAGHNVALLARGERLISLRQHGVLLAEGNSPDIRSVPVPVVEHPDGGYDLFLVLVRTHQVDAVLDSLSGLHGDVLFMLNWAAGPEPLSRRLGRERVLLGFPAAAGTLDGEVVRYRPDNFITRLVQTPIGEPDGRTTPRVERIIRVLRSVGLRAKAEPHTDAWLKTHAVIEVPLLQAVFAAGGPKALADDPGGVRRMIRHMRQNLADMSGPPIPRMLASLLKLPEVLLSALVRRFLRSSVAAQLNNPSPAAVAELARLAEQIRT
ncbi:hypothetical protein KDC22_16625 [Paenibacillus tritici]|uniref:ketopantoate reductase family protein n=1 Tax=Paenibacillus tritici TaxID=1873425 RepID=UPI001BA8F88B|nr:2-dehydropantoate 2-reductase N-terminal domain-containing protein [Paenibacillus tritici]QUL52108.1 hypothetical protein KDC22_16625 [Paenibacillus tritici]